MARSDLVILIPAFNEADTIGNTVAEAKKYGSVLVVDDGSSDETAQRALDNGALVKSLSVNQGYDAALTQGFIKAQSLGFRHLITFDADGQHPSELLNEFSLSLSAGNALVLGIRSSQARWAEKLFSWYAKARFSVQDPLCGMKGYAMDAFEEIGFFDSYGSIGTELMFRIIQKQHKFQQIPFAVQPRQDESRFGSSIKANNKILGAMLKTAFKL